MLYLVNDPRYKQFAEPKRREPAKEEQASHESDIVAREGDFVLRESDFAVIIRGPPDACEVVVPAIN